MQQLENENLDLFLRDMGILPQTYFEDLQDLPPPPTIEIKGMWRDLSAIYDQDGEITF